MTDTASLYVLVFSMVFFAFGFIAGRLSHDR